MMYKNIFLIITVILMLVSGCGVKQPIETQTENKIISTLEKDESSIDTQDNYDEASSVEKESDIEEINSDYPKIPMIEDWLYTPEGVTEVEFDNYSIKEEIYELDHTEGTDVRVSSAIINIEGNEIATTFLNDVLREQAYGSWTQEKLIEYPGAVTLRTDYTITYADERILSIAQYKVARQSWRSGITIDMTTYEIISTLDFGISENMLDTDQVEEIIITDLSNIFELKDVALELSEIPETDTSFFISNKGIGLICSNSGSSADSGFLWFELKSDIETWINEYFLE